VGHIYVKARFVNGLDYARFLMGELKLEDVRRIDVNALVDTGATFPALPEDVIKELGLFKLGEHEAETADGTVKIELYGYAVIFVEDRLALSPIIKRPEGTSPLIGVVALEQMGFRVDPVTGRLIKGLPLML
jgi:clan AA aspartic protease